MVCYFPQIKAKLMPTKEDFYQSFWYLLKTIKFILNLWIANKLLGFF